jgi:hypothetical protein|tara:strand:- start:614 stop:784 length:171 start_codon:yes stop_codon:yes gene_type:complete
MGREIDYDKKKNAHNDILIDKPKGKMTVSQLQAKVEKLYILVHDFIEYHHTTNPDS